MGGRVGVRGRQKGKGGRGWEGGGGDWRETEWRGISEAEQNSNT